ncbi:MAG: VWA domain-containing protein, partial [Anaerolineae bacterium]|nr:VWA domain-containing protein [Anaerolineae bacterium]
MKAKPLLFVVTLSLLLLGAVVGFSAAQQSEMPLVINSDGEQGISNSALVLVIDISSSMNTSVVFNSTVTAAQAVVAEADGQIPIAIVTFGDNVRVVQEYTSDTEVLNAALTNLNTSESALLYDGALQGVELASELDVENAAIILFTDSSDQARSTSGRSQAIQLARGRNLPVYALALEWNGSINAETDYLLDLTRAGGGELYEVTVAQAESGEISRLSLAVVDDLLSNNVITPTSEADTIGAIDPSGETDLVQQDNQEGIDPNVTFGIEETPAPETGLVPEGTDFVLPVGNVLPISINVEQSQNIVRAELSINQTKLETFTQDANEYTYDLDLGRLRRSGTYVLVFTATTEENLLFGSEFEFDVEIL